MRLRNVKGSREAIQESIYVVHEEETRAGNWHDIFGNDHPIHIEIGMGKGRFLMELAAKNLNGRPPKSSGIRTALSAYIS